MAMVNKYVVESQVLGTSHFAKGVVYKGLKYGACKLGATNKDRIEVSSIPFLIKPCEYHIPLLGSLNGCIVDVLSHASRTN